MREGLDAATLALYISGKFDLHSKLTVENGSHSQINLQGRYTDYALKLPDPNQPIGSMVVSFVRETTKAGLTTSLAPMVTTSSYNKLNDNVTYSPLLQLGRIVRLQIALTEIGGARPVDASTLWYEVFQGYITNVNWPEWDSRKASISCNGLAGILQLAKTEALYNYAAGTTLENVAQAILTNNGFGTVPLYFPAPTNKVIPVAWAPQLQKTVWSQIWDLAQSMGWIAYYRYRTRLGPPELFIFAPDRTKVTTNMDIDAYDFRGLEVSEEEVRNVGYLAYYDANSTHQLFGPLVDNPSIAKYGGSKQIRRTFWISLELESPIRNAIEAENMLTAALSDVANPDAVASALTFPLVFAESGVDRYKFLAKDRLFNADQNFSPFGIDINVAANQLPVSVVSVRGVPSAGSKTWTNISFGEREPTPEDATGYASVAINPDGTVQLVLGSADPDTAYAKYKIALAATGGAFPVIDGTSTTVLVANMPVNTVVPGLLPERWQVARLTAQFFKADDTPGEIIRHQASLLGAGGASIYLTAAAIPGTGYGEVRLNANADERVTWWKVWGRLGDDPTFDNATAADEGDLDPRYLIWDGSIRQNVISKTALGGTWYFVVIGYDDLGIAGVPSTLTLTLTSSGGTTPPVGSAGGELYDFYVLGLFSGAHRLTWRHNQELQNSTAYTIDIVCDQPYGSGVTSRNAKLDYDGTDSQSLYGSVDLSINGQVVAEGTGYYTLFRYTITLYESGTVRQTMQTERYEWLALLIE